MIEPNNLFDRGAADYRPPAEEAETAAPAMQPQLFPEAGPTAGLNAFAPTEPELVRESAEDETTGTPRDVREVTQELLKHGYIEEASKPAQFRRAMTHERHVLAALEPLDLALKLDAHRGVAFLVVGDSARNEADDGSAWKHPLVRRQRLTLEQSLLVAILRQAFMMHEQEAGVGQTNARVAVDELLPQYLTYFPDSGSDQKNESRLLSLLDQLKTYGIVSEVDKQEQVTVRPMIAHLANPESLAALLQVLKEQAVANVANESGGDQ